MGAIPDAEELLIPSIKVTVSSAEQENRRLLTIVRNKQ
jgi:hypothetical protein